MITLFDYWRSSTAYRIRIALNLLGLPHEIVPVNLLKGEHRTPEYLKRNPQGIVPTLEIDGVTLTQSLAILEYLDEVHAAAFLPKTPLERARVRALSYAIGMEIHPICNLYVARYAVENSGGNLSMESWAQHFIARGLAGLEGMLDSPMTGLCCHGDSITMPDLCLVPQVYNARRWGVDLAAYPRLNETSIRLEAMPAFAAAHPDLHAAASS